MKLRRLLAGLAFVVTAAGVVSAGYFTGVWIPNYPNTIDYPVRGIDVSGHQGVIQWNRVPHNSVDFVYIKATEGKDFRDARFTENWRGSAQAGLRHGAYHFFTMKSTGLQQAAHFTSVVPKDPEALPPVVDVEQWGNPPARPKAEEFQRQLSDFLGVVRSYYGREPVIYTANDFREHFLRDYPIRRLWISSFVTMPKVPAHVGWQFWQFSERGRVPGISGFVDQNVFHGDREAFEAFTRQDR